MEATEIEGYEKLSSDNDFTIRFSSKCGCYHCLATFKPSKIKEWVDDGSTALCPECGIDAVVPDSLIKISRGHLKEMNKLAFQFLTEVNKSVIIVVQINEETKHG